MKEATVSARQGRAEGRTVAVGACRLTIATSRATSVTKVGRGVPLPPREPREPADAECGTAAIALTTAAGRGDRQAKGWGMKGGREGTRGGRHYAQSTYPTP